MSITLVQAELMILLLQKNKGEKIDFLMFSFTYKFLKEENVHSVLYVVRFSQMKLFKCNKYVQALNNKTCISCH
jgi:hypothetical protein